MVEAELFLAADRIWGRLKLRLTHAGESWRAGSPGRALALAAAKRGSRGGANNCLYTPCTRGPSTLAIGSSVANKALCSSTGYFTCSNVAFDVTITDAE